MDEVLCIHVERWEWLVGVNMGRPRMEQVCDRLLILILEDDVEYELMIFRGSELGRFVGMLGIELAEADFQGKEEKSLLIRKSLFIHEPSYTLTYHGTPLIRRCCQPGVTLFPLGQVIQDV